MDKNPKDRDDLTPLHLAAENGHIAICQFILNNVVYKNPHNKTGWTPLHWAAGKGKLYVIFITLKIFWQLISFTECNSPNLLVNERRSNFCWLLTIQT